MSGYELLYARRAVKDIESLDRVAQKQLAKKMTELAKDPQGQSRRLANSELGTWRYRVGDYRVVFDIEGHEIIVLRVGHRREIYR